VKQLITYADADVPVAGVLGPGRADDLQDFLSGMFQTVRVDPAERNAE
jgi:hypothetical protein